VKRLMITAIAVLAASCGQPPEPGPEDGDREYLEGWAGRLAPFAALPESLWPEAPDSAGIDELIRACDADPALYLYFYDCLDDSIYALDPGPSQTPPVPQEDSLSTTSPGGRSGTDPSTL
jgi:hypothetical protein